MAVSSAPLRVMLACAELAPWAKTGGLGDVAAALPAALRALGVDMRVLLPAYPQVAAQLGNTRAIAHTGALPGAYPRAGLLTGVTASGVPVYAVDCPALYARAGDPYHDASGREWPDNHLRFGLLSKVAALIAQDELQIGWTPQILHCNDWHTGLAPAYLHFAQRTTPRSVFTIHNLAYQGLFKPRVLDALALPPDAFSVDGIEFHGRLSFLKAGIQYADALTTVSPAYAREIQQEPDGFGMAGLLHHHRGKLSGILNGIDVELWNPANDTHLAASYDCNRLHAKLANKTALQLRLGLTVTDKLPLLGVVSRFTPQKGLDLLLAIAHDVLALPAQLVVLGSGDRELEHGFSELARENAGTCAAVVGFDDGLAHLIEAGADMFVMPSRYEPCGLNQLYSLRYGTPPVAHATGGLADTVIDYSAAALAAGTANGFTFGNATAQALLAALDRAADTWHDHPTWRELQRNGMSRDHSWRASARRYSDMYRSLVARDTIRPA